MPQATNTPTPYDAAAYSRRGGGTVLAAAAVVAVMVQTHGTCSGHGWNPGFTGFLSLFSWAHWILVVLLAGAGIALIRTRDNSTIAAAVGLVAAAQLAGAGIVGYRHWEPAGGMSGCSWNNMNLIKGLAVLGAIAGAVAALTCLRALLATGRLPASSGISIVGRVCVAIGALVAVSLPLLLAIGDPHAHDMTSLGAFALLWSLPWGGALALAAWLRRPAAIAAALAVAVSAESAYPNYALVQVEHHWIAVIVGLVSGLLVAGLRLAPASRSGLVADPR